MFRITKDPLQALARLSVFIGFAERISGIMKEFIKKFIRILMLKQVKKKKLWSKNLGTIGGDQKKFGHDQVT